jgi:hypothetical protein
MRKPGSFIGSVGVWPVAVRVWVELFPQVWEPSSSSSGVLS